jgi:secreted trypsin-like serine protease
VQVGITSYGRECGSGKVAVYTKVSAFMGWIEDIIGKNK